MILITGASRGLGKACAFSLASLNMDLILISRKEKDLLPIKKTIESTQKIKVFLFCLDLSDSAKVLTWVDENQDFLSKVKILINNAAIGGSGTPFDIGDPYLYRDMIQTNFLTPTLLMRTFFNLMKKNQGGHIINISSYASQNPYPNGHLYCATKAALDSLSHSLGIESKTSHIKVSVVRPGIIKSENKKPAISYPLLPQEVADVVLWIATQPMHIHIREIILTPMEQT